MDKDVSPAVVVVILVLVAAILVGLYFLVFQTEITPEDTEMYGTPGIVAPQVDVDDASAVENGAVNDATTEADEDEPGTASEVDGEDVTDENANTLSPPEERNAVSE